VWLPDHVGNPCIGYGTISIGRPPHSSGMEGGRAFPPLKGKPCDPEPQHAAEAWASAMCSRPLILCVRERACYVLDWEKLGLGSAWVGLCLVCDLSEKEMRLKTEGSRVTFYTRVCLCIVNQSNIFVPKFQSADTRGKGKRRGNQATRQGCE